MLRILFASFLVCFSLASYAENSIQKLFKSVNSGVVELHVKALSQPKPGQVMYRASTSGSLGSGAIISDTGRILTAAHVVDRATEIEVIFADGTKRSGHVVWVDSLIDLAMIQVANPPKNLKVLKLAKSGDYEIGEQILVIGAPYGVSHSLSVGYLSGIRDRDQIPGTNYIPRFLQTDAAINQGNSGGPMFNREGEIIGIVSHILSQTGGSNGLGFSVSIDTVLDVIDSDPGLFFGVIPHLLSKAQSDAINNPYGYGLLIQQVVPGTLADKLGFEGGSVNVMIGNTPVLLGGDILVRLGNYPLDTLESVIKAKKAFDEYKKGEKIEFRYLRKGKVKTVKWVVD